MSVQDDVIGIVRNDVPKPMRNRALVNGVGAVPTLKLLAKVGDSVLLDVKVGSLGILAARAGLKGKYSARKQPDGSIRVWRVRE